MRLLCLAVCLLFVADASAQRGRRSRVQYSNQVSSGVVMGGQTSPTITMEEQRKYTNATKNLDSSENAIDEVNAKRARAGLKPLVACPLLCKGALAVSKQRAARRIDGHLPESDFSYLPAGAQAASGGVGALEDSWGWETCAYDNPSYTIGGAAWVRGSDGKRYMSFFGR